MGKICLIGVFACLLAVLAGCNREPAAQTESSPVEAVTETDVRADLLHYVRIEMPKIAAADQKATNLYRAVTGTNFKGDNAFYEALPSKIIPAYEGLLDTLQTIAPQTEAVQKLHALFVDSGNKMLEGLGELQAGFESNDFTLSSLGRQKTQDASKLKNDWKLRLQEMAGQHDIPLR